MDPSTIQYLENKRTISVLGPHLLLRNFLTDTDSRWDTQACQNTPQNLNVELKLERKLMYDIEARLGIEISRAVKETSLYLLCESIQMLCLAAKAVNDVSELINHELKLANKPMSKHDQGMLLESIIKFWTMIIGIQTECSHPLHVCQDPQARLCPNLAISLRQASGH
jgi:hypothetical protein